MIYFLLGLACAGLVEPKARELWRHAGFWLALVLAAVVVAPNVAWNAAHDFATFRHTRANFVGQGFRFDLSGPLVFIGSQFGVCGPVAFGVFLLGLIRFPRFVVEPADRILLAFALPALALVMLAAFVVTAEANWAAPSALMVILLSTIILVRQRQWRWLKLALAIGLGLQAVLMVSDAYADRISLPFLEKPDVYHRTMGWKAMAQMVGERAQESGAQSVVADRGDVVPELLYYLRRDNVSVWSYSASGPLNQFDLDRPWTPSAPQPVLFVGDHPLPGNLASAYPAVEVLNPVQAPTGPRSTRDFLVFNLSAPAR
jgi:hypothetical protein